VKHEVSKLLGEYVNISSKGFPEKQIVAWKAKTEKLSELLT